MFEDRLPEAKLFAKLAPLLHADSACRISTYRSCRFPIWKTHRINQMLWSCSRVPLGS